MLETPKEKISVTVTMDGDAPDGEDDGVEEVEEYVVDDNDILTMI